MRRTFRLIATAALMTVALVVPASAAVAATTTTTANAAVYLFALSPPNTATAPSAGTMAAPGDWIQVSGAGAFVPSAGTVHAGGAFVHHNADGTIHCRGTWKATALTGWTDFDAARDRRHGGVLSLLVTHYCPAMAEVHTNIAMTLTSTLHAPSTSVLPGVTVGDFTLPTAGSVIVRAFPKAR